MKRIKSSFGRLALAAAVVAGSATIVAPQAQAGQHVREHASYGALARSAPVVVTGRVTVSRATIDGNTRVAFIQVERWLKGDRPQTTIATVAINGSSDQPALSAGERVVLFLDQAEQILAGNAAAVAGTGAEGVAVARAFTVVGGHNGAVRIDGAAGAAVEQLVDAHLAFGSDPIRMRSTLVQALAHPDERIATDAAQDLLFLAALGHVPTAQQAQTCADVLTHDRTKLVDAGPLVELLGKTGETEALRAILNFAIANDGSRYHRETGAAMRELSAGSSVASLVAFLPQAGDDTIRARVARALGDLGGAQAVEALRGLAESGSASVRNAAVLALGEAGDVNTLAAALRGGDETTARAAACALVRAGRPGVDALRSFLAADGSESSRSTFVDSLLRDPVNTTRSFRRQIGQ